MTSGVVSQYDLQNIMPFFHQVFIMFVYMSVQGIHCMHFHELTMQECSSIVCFTSACDMLWPKLRWPNTLLYLCYQGSLLVLLRAYPCILRSKRDPRIQEIWSCIRSLTAQQGSQELINLSLHTEMQKGSLDLINLELPK